MKQQTTQEQTKKPKGFLAWAQGILILICVGCVGALVWQYGISRQTPQSEPATVATVPAYVYEEADRVAQTLDDNAFLMAVVTDTHIGVHQEDGVNRRSAQLASQGLQAVQKRQKLHMLAMLGDYTYAGNTYEKETVLQDINLHRDIFRPLTLQLPAVYLQGNHDTNHYAHAKDPNTPKLTQQEVFEQLGKHNTVGVTDGQNPYGNYGYADFEEHKIRVIYLNTCDSEQYEIGVSEAQLRWLTEEALDVTDKPDGDRWSILVLSHHPLDWNYRTVFVIEILEDYQVGKADKMPYTHDDTKGQFYYDFSHMEKRATVVANIHGHVHNFSSGHIGDNGWLLRVCIPNSSYDRNNQYDNDFAERDENGEKIYWEKTQYTAEGTSFCVVAVDTADRTIRLSCFGAGYDREFVYHPYQK